MRIKIPNIDRVGLVHDIAKVLATRQINIISMEVELKILYLETAPLTEETTAALFRDLSNFNIVPHLLIPPNQHKSFQFMLFI
ncbi:hypothetical protein HA075_20485 [bacterium BFN5]|nr:hypothetical protein HA075_20485 [bacterium BFN5]